MKTLNLGVRMNQGDDFNVVIGINGDSGPIDITGYEFLGEMKANTDPNSSVIAEFSFTILNQVSNRGQVQWSLTAAATKALTASVSDAERRERLETNYVFDVKMKDTSGKINRIIQGIIYLSPEVTQEDFA